MPSDEASAAAQRIATQLVEDFIEAEPCIGLLDTSSKLHITSDQNYRHPCELLEDAARVEGRCWIGVVVVMAGTARRLDSDEVLGQVRTVTACFGGDWWDHLALLPTGVVRMTDRPDGDIPDAMHRAVRRLGP